MRVEPFDLLAHADEARDLQSAALRTVVEATGVGGSGDDVHYAAHAGRAGFRAVAAWDGERLCGFGYGYHEAPGSWWDRWVRPALAAAGEQGLLDGAFEVVELHVAPDRHGQGLGRRLLQALLAGVRAPRVLLTTQDGANPARGFYRQLGFREIAPVQYGDVPFLVLASELPLSRGQRDWV